MFRKKKLIRNVAIFLAAAMLSACGGGNSTDSQGNQTPAEQKSTEQAASDQPAGAAKDVIVIAQQMEAVSVDPHASNDSATSVICFQIYNSLVQFDLEMNITGDLAENWEIVDDLTWQFNLRKGVKWHNGEDFTADDVKFSIERMKETSGVAHLVEAISEVEVVDDNTVLFHTTQPYATMLPNLAHSASKMVNRKAVEESGESYGEHPIGTGPFKFVEWIKGERVVLDRFDDYFEGPAKSKQLIIKAIPENSSRTIALETGEADIIFDVEPVDKKIIEANEETELLETPSNRIEVLSFNTTKEFLNDKKVRQALCYAIDAKSILEVAEDGRGVLANTVTGPTVFGFAADLEGYTYDPEKAKSLLAEAGYPDGFTTTIWASGDVRKRMAEIIQANLAEIGVTATIDLLEWGAYLDRSANSEHDMFLTGWSNITADSDGGLYSNFHSSKFGKGGNRSFYKNDEVDQLLDEGRIELDTEKRLEIYHKAQELIMEDAPWDPLYYKTLNLGIRKGLQGVVVHPGSQFRFYGVHY